VDQREVGASIVNNIGTVELNQEYWESMQKSIAQRNVRYPNKTEREKYYGPDTSLEELRTNWLEYMWKDGAISACCGAYACHSFPVFNKVNCGITIFVSEVKAQDGQVDFSLGTVTELPLDNGMFMYIKTFEHGDPNCGDSTTKPSNPVFSLPKDHKFDVASVHFAHFFSYHKSHKVQFEEVKKYKYNCYSNNSSVS